MELEGVEAGGGEGGREVESADAGCWSRGGGGGEEVGPEIGLALRHGRKGYVELRREMLGVLYNCCVWRVSK